MKEDYFSYYHKILGSFKAISKKFIKEFKDDHIANFKIIPNKLYCSLDCANLHKKDEFVYKLQRNGTLMPIDYLIVECRNCKKIIKASDDLYYSTINPLDKFTRINLFESIFCKYFLVTLTTNILHRFYTMGTLYSITDYSEFAIAWIRCVLHYLIKILSKNQSFYRAQFNLYPTEGIIDLKNKELMRLPDVFYYKDNRFTRAGVNNIYFSADIETCKAEINYKSGKYYTAQFISTKDIKVLDLTTLDNPINYYKLSNDIYRDYVNNYNENKQINILIESAINCIGAFFMPYVSLKSVIDHTFRPEYIISQLLADISKTLFIDGLLYFSTKISNNQCLCFYHADKLDEYFNQQDTIEHNE